MKKAYILGFITGLALLMVAGVAGFQQQQKSDQAKQSEQALYEAELADATQVEAGALTQNQRVHSRLYSGYRRARNSNTISELVARAKGRGNYVRIGTFVGLGPALTKPETPENYFAQLAAESDAVIRGRAVRKVSQITEDNSSIFTDYDVEVSEVLKNNMAAPFDPGGTIIVTRSGGKVVVDGVIVNFSNDYYAPLPMNNHELVLFLKFIPETGAYKATRTTGSFEIDKSSLRPLTRASFPVEILQDGPSFLKTVRAVSDK